jgi:hypothetical protein
MPIFNLEITPATASALAGLSAQQRRFIESSLAAELDRLLPSVLTRNLTQEQTVQEIEDILARAEQRALAEE